MQEVNAIVAGAGVWGCTVARLLAEKGLNVLVLEERSAPGGNCRTEDVDGIEVHTFGSHIFHTHIARVWDFVRRFTEFNGYQHKVLARHGEKTYFMPLGLTLVNGFYGIDLKPEELAAFIAGEVEKAGVPDKPANFEEQAIAFVGRPLYEAFIKNYTLKQWNRDPKELDASIIKRLPVRSSYDTNYFSDLWQGIPSGGYNALFDALLNHPRITLKCSVDYLAVRKTLPEVPVFYSGAIDRLCGWRLGALPWRSLRFERESLPIADYQGTSVMNYTDADVPYTRIHEFKHFHPERKDVMEKRSTEISIEYPADWKEGDEPYYPVSSRESEELVGAYRKLAAEMFPGMIVGGRLGGYKYYDMDRSIDAAFDAVDKFCRV